LLYLTLGAIAEKSLGSKKGKELRNSVTLSKKIKKGIIQNAEEDAHKDHRKKREGQSRKANVPAIRHDNSSW